MKRGRALTGFVKGRKAGYAGLVCLAAGICLIAAPYGKERYEDYRQHNLLTEWREEKEQRSTTKQQEENEFEIYVEGESVVGVLKIAKIDLEEPILKDATKAHLNVSACTVEPTGEPGKKGNFALSGHNSRTYGRHFNRLQELDVGDEIVVEALNGDYVYEVGETFIVSPEDVWVLAAPDEGAEMTLITCCYPKSGEEARFIVKADLR